MPQAIDYRRVRELYESGHTDAEISRELGCHKTTVYEWRDGTNKPSNSYPIRNLLDREGPALYAAGLIDPQIAKRLKVKPRTVRSWRKRHTLEPNFKHDFFSLILLEPAWQKDRERIAALHEEGMTDGEIAEAMEKEEKNVARVRQRMRLKANKPGRRVAAGRE